MYVGLIYTYKPFFFLFEKLQKKKQNFLVFGNTAKNC